MSHFAQRAPNQYVSKNEERRCFVAWDWTIDSSSVQFSSRWDRCARKAHMRSTRSLRSVPNVAFKAVPTFVWPTMALSRPFKDRLALPLSTHLSSGRTETSDRKRCRVAAWAKLQALVYGHPSFNESDARSIRVHGNHCMDIYGRTPTDCEPAPRPWFKANGKLLLSPAWHDGRVCCCSGPWHMPMHTRRSV